MSRAPKVKQIEDPPRHLKPIMGKGFSAAS